MNGEFNSAIEGLKNDMSLEAGNILRNSSFLIIRTTGFLKIPFNFINVDGKFLWMDGSFTLKKRRSRHIQRDGNKNVIEDS